MRSNFLAWPPRILTTRRRLPRTILSLKGGAHRRGKRNSMRVELSNFPFTNKIVPSKSRSEAESALKIRFRLQLRVRRANGRAEPRAPNAMKKINCRKRPASGPDHRLENRAFTYGNSSEAGPPRTPGALNQACGLRPTPRSRVSPHEAH